MPTTSVQSATASARVDCLDGGREQIGRADGGACFAPVRGVGGDDGEPVKAEVGHGAGRRADVEGIARGDENHFEAVALGFWRQEMIVERGRMPLDLGLAGNRFRTCP